jgi:hypothetical protein
MEIVHGLEQFRYNARVILISLSLLYQYVSPLTHTKKRGSVAVLHLNSSSTPSDSNITSVTLCNTLQETACSLQLFPVSATGIFPWKSPCNHKLCGYRSISYAWWHQQQTCSNGNSHALANFSMCDSGWVDGLSFFKVIKIIFARNIFNTFYVHKPS